MTWQPDYVTAAALATHLRDTVSADSGDLQIAVTAASRLIDRAARRQFGQDASAVARYYTYDGIIAEGRPLLIIDDSMDATVLVVMDTANSGSYTQTLTLGTDFDMWPKNAAADGRPYTGILLRPYTAARFPYAANAVRVTTKFGWVSVPILVVQATLIQASRFFMRKDSAFGVAGSPDLGNELRLLAKVDPDVDVLLSPVYRWWGAL